MTKAVKKSTSVSKPKTDVKKKAEFLDKYTLLTTPVSEVTKFIKTASIEDMVKVVVGRTNAWAKQYDGLNPEHKMDPKAAKIEKMFQSGEVEFGCKNDRAIRLFSLLLGEDICQKKKGDVEIKALIGVVLINNPNSHSYEVGSPIVTFRDGYAAQLKMSGNSGNNMPSEMSAYRIATEEEITNFLTTTETKFRSLM